MHNKVDITVCFYRQAHRAPFFWWGIEANKEHINRVFVVNDEPGSLDLGAPEGINVTYLSHPHEGHGVGRCYNEGAALSTTDYILFLAFDVILAPGAVRKMLALANPDTMVLAPLDNISEYTTLTSLPHPEVVLSDMEDRLGLWDRHHKQARVFLSARNGYTLVDRRAHNLLGGFDQEYCKLGYGLEDYDYGLRWVDEFGYDKIVRATSARSWHFAKLEDRKQPAQGCEERFSRRLGEHFGGRYKLVFNESENIYEDFLLFALIRNKGEKEQRPMDAAADCVGLDWLLDGSASVIATEPRGLDHLKLCRQKLRPGGRLILPKGWDDGEVDKLGDVRTDITPLGYEVTFA